MNKISFSILLVLALGFSDQIWACTCIGEISAKKAVRQSDFVFMGKVIEAEDVVDSISVLGWVNTIAQRRYTFEVQIVFKGKRKTKQVQITTGFGNGDCGFEFAMGREYVVYATYSKRQSLTSKKVESFLSTDVCTRTTGKVEEETRLIRRRCWGRAGR